MRIFEPDGISTVQTEDADILQYPLAGNAIVANASRILPLVKVDEIAAGFRSRSIRAVRILPVGAI